MQVKLGRLDESVRRIRAHIASLTPCDPGLPALDDLSEIQVLLVEGMILPFESFTIACHADPRSAWSEGAEWVCDAVLRNCYEAGGRGSEIDAEIERLAGLPKIEMALPGRAREADIADPEKMDLGVLCCSLAYGLHILCDCHHSTFRWIENWIYAVGAGRWGFLVAG